MTRWWQLFYPFGVFRVRRWGSPKQGMKTVYLTFDDGPIPEVTPQVLAILNHYHVKATFFMVGHNIEKHPDTFKQVVKAGHSVGNHTYHHVKGWRTPTRRYLAEVEACQEIINRTFSNRKYFRPPYGKAWLWQRWALYRRGYRLIYWDVLTRDYDARQSPEAMLRLIQRNTRNGSIINFHDSRKSNERMLNVLPQAIEWLQAQGYTLEAL